MHQRNLALAAVAVSMTTAACGGATGDSVATKPQTPETVTSAAVTPAPTPTTDEAVHIEVAGDQVKSGPSRIAAKVGEDVKIVVTSDVADTVHLHGYDVEVPVAPGQPATLTVSADIPGVFEIELEDGGLKIAELAVRG
ncbi:MAG: hypothetical protein M3O70_20755 [Actinomycetota bacterium]|nr:hypothetical protein [Actinomycetota bacterium]